MADVDALVTIADPWTNLGEVRNEVAFLGLEGAWEKRLKALCQAELEQAHGRLRAVHRSHPGRALHIGTVAPSGVGWSRGVELRGMPHGPASQPAAMSLDEFRSCVDKLGGISPAALVIGCSARSVARYYAGTRPVPRPVAVALAMRA